MTLAVDLAVFFQKDSAVEGKSWWTISLQPTESHPQLTSSCKTNHSHASNVVETVYAGQSNQTALATAKHQPTAAPLHMSSGHPADLSSFRIPAGH